VVRNIKCEFRDAVLVADPRSIWLDNYNAVFALTLVSYHKGGLTGDATLTHPLDPGTFSLPLILSDTGEASRTEKINFKDKVENLRVLAGVDCPLGNEGTGRDHLLGGYIGIEKLLIRADESNRIAKITPSSLDYTLSFMIVKTGSIGPKFSLIPVGDNTLSAGLKWEGMRRTTHTLNITLTEKINTEPCPKRLKYLIDRDENNKPIYKCLLPVASVEFDIPQDQKSEFRDGGKPVIGTPADPRAIVGEPGLTEQEKRALDSALGRSILQDTLEELRQRELTE
jgi:hypothetical protein